MYEGIFEQFGICMTQRYACTYRVMDLLRSRHVGNSPSAVIRGILSQHSRRHADKVLKYLSFIWKLRIANPYGSSIAVEDVPKPVEIPRAKWLRELHSSVVSKDAYDESINFQYIWKFSKDRWNSITL